MNHSLFAIWRNGEPLESHSAGIKRNAFEQIGSAKSVLTSLVTKEIHSKYKVYSHYSEEFKQFDRMIREEYEIKEYVPK